MKGLRRRFASFGTWIGGILLAVVLLPKEISPWIVIGFTGFWLLVKCSGPIWRLIKKGVSKLSGLRAAYQEKEGSKEELRELKANLVELKSIVKQAQSGQIEAANTPFEGSTMIDRQLCARITEKLQTLYPEASWSWLSDDRPSVLASSCLVGQIKIADAEEYNQAEVSFLANGQIEIRMMAVKDFEQIKASKNQKELTLEDWYASTALPMLRDCIDDLFSRGIKTVQLTDQGKLLAKESGKQKSYGQLSNMPAINQWQKFIELLAEEDISAVREETGLILSWGN